MDNEMPPHLQTVEHTQEKENDEKKFSGSKKWFYCSTKEVHDQTQEIKDHLTDVSLTDFGIDVSTDSKTLIGGRYIINYYTNQSVALLTTKACYMDQESFTKLYRDFLTVFPPETDDPRLRYSKRTWVFPQHLDIVVRFARDLAKKYQANEEICALAALLHDAGLAYKRTTASSMGHEERSKEYAEKYLPDYGYSHVIIQAVVQCIAATEKEYQPTTLEQKIVRTADALAHFLSIHYFAKVNFSAHWPSAIDFLEKKIQIDWQKICLPDEREMIRPVYTYLDAIVKQYRRQTDIMVV